MSAETRLGLADARLDSRGSGNIYPRYQSYPLSRQRKRSMRSDLAFLRPRAGRLFARPRSMTRTKEYKETETPQRESIHLPAKRQKPTSSQGVLYTQTNRMGMQLTGDHSAADPPIHQQSGECELSPPRWKSGTRQWGPTHRSMAQHSDESPPHPERYMTCQPQEGRADRQRQMISQQNGESSPRPEGTLNTNTSPTRRTDPFLRRRLSLGKIDAGVASRRRKRNELGSRLYKRLISQRTQTYQRMRPLHTPATLA